MFKGKKYKSKLLALLVTGSFNRQFKPNKTPVDWTTSDEKIIEEHIKDTNPNCKFTASSYLELFKMDLNQNIKFGKKFLLRKNFLN